MDNISELGSHEPSVESVISRLDRFQDKIRHMTVVIEWEDESLDVFHDTKDVPQICYESMILRKYTESLMFNGIEEE